MGKSKEEKKEREEEKEKIVYRIGWLSAQTTTPNDTKDMDAFLTDLSIETSGPSPPLMILLQAWSLYDRKWWSADPAMRIEWIDTLAEEYSAESVEEVIIPLVQRGQKKKN
jgi:hypothetical protein